jgi:hypothetical protein
MMVNGEHSGKKLEFAFEKMYKGNKGNFLNCCRIINEVLENMMKKGYLTFERYENVKAVLESAYNRQECKIISCNSDIITVLNTENDTFDSFSLTDMISWFVEMVTTDLLFRTNLKGHYDYAGMINCLESLSETGDDTSTDLSKATNAVTRGKYMYIVDTNDEGTIKLWRIRKEENGFRSKSSPKEMMLLATRDVFQDFKRNCFYVNHADGWGRKINIVTGEASPLAGKIISITNQGELVVRMGKELLIVKDENEIARIGDADDTILNMSETNGVSWISSKNGEMNYHWYFNGNTGVSHSLKSEVIWRYILKNAYDFHSDPDKKMSSTLWRHKCCQTPMPFDIKTIHQTIEQIEKGLIDGEVEKTAEYADIIGPLLNLSENPGDVTDTLMNLYNVRVENIGFTEVEPWEFTRCIFGGEEYLLADNTNSQQKEWEHNEDSTFIADYVESEELDEMIKNITDKIDAKIRELEENEAREKSKEKRPKVLAKAAKGKKKSKKLRRKPEARMKKPTTNQHKKGTRTLGTTDKDVLMEREDREWLKTREILNMDTRMETPD